MTEPSHRPSRRWAREGATERRHIAWIPLGGPVEAYRGAADARREPRGPTSRSPRDVTTARRATETRLPPPAPLGPVAPVPAPCAPANQMAPLVARPQGPAPGRRAASQWAPECGLPVRAARAEPAQSEKSEPNPSGPLLRTRRRRRRRRRLLPPDRVYCPNPKVQFCGPAAASERDDTGVRQVSSAGARVRPGGPGRPLPTGPAAPAARPGQPRAGGGRGCEAGLPGSEAGRGEGG